VKTEQKGPIDKIEGDVKTEEDAIDTKNESRGEKEVDDPQ
jgi:hypothetical protein